MCCADGDMTAERYRAGKMAVACVRRRSAALQDTRKATLAATLVRSTEGGGYNEGDTAPVADEPRNTERSAGHERLDVRQVTARLATSLSDAEVAPQKHLVVRHRRS